MNSSRIYSACSIEEILGRAMEKEKELVNYYTVALQEVGPDAAKTIRDLLNKHEEHACKLEELLEEIGELRELSMAMAD